MKLPLHVSYGPEGIEVNLQLMYYYPMSDTGVGMLDATCVFCRLARYQWAIRHAQFLSLNKKKQKMGMKMALMVMLYHFHLVSMAFIRDSQKFLECQQEVMSLPPQTSPCKSPSSKSYIGKCWKVWGVVLGWSEVLEGTDILNNL